MLPYLNPYEGGKVSTLEMEQNLMVMDAMDN
jgi:hypothetical protein